MAQIKALQLENAVLKTRVTPTPSSPSSSSIAVTAEADAIVSKPPPSSRSFEKIKDPESFSGNRSQAPLFISRLKRHLDTYPDRFDSEKEKVNWAANLLRSSSATWWYNLEQRNAAPTTFSGFIEVFTKYYVRSDPAAKSSALRKLKSLTQTASCESYASSFLEHYPATGIDDTSARDIFMSGLKPTLRIQVAGQPTPADLMELILMAISIDENMFQYTPPPQKK